MMRKLGIFLLVAVLIAAALVMLLPINKIAETQIKQMMAENGLPPLAFTLKNMALDHALFTDLSLDQPRLSAGQLRVDFIRNGSDFSGKWQLDDLMPPPNPLNVPMLYGQGTWRYQAGVFEMKGRFTSKDETHQANVALTDKQVRVSNVSLPWEGGRLTSKQAVISLPVTQPISFEVNVERVPLERLLALMAPGKALATGVVSGKLPVTLDGNTWRIDAGKLQTLDPGVVKLSPDVLPVTNEQMAMLRDVLADFHYQEFALSLDSGKDEQLSILLQLRGNNPGLYNGREVKMNVNLSGDVLQLIQHSIVPTVSPEQFLKQDQP